MYRQQIKRLKESLSRILIEENAKSRVYSDCGTILANRAWRVGRSNNNKIFYKDIENEKGNTLLIYYWMQVALKVEIREMWQFKLT